MSLDNYAARMVKQAGELIFQSEKFVNEADQLINSFTGCINVVQNRLQSARSSSNDQVLETYLAQGESCAIAFDIGLEVARSSVNRAIQVTTDVTLRCRDISWEICQ